MQVLSYFVFAALIAAAVIYAYTRCLRSTLLVVVCSLIAVLWQLGLVAALGYELDPYSMLVPFLVFAIGVSHGAQKMNGIMQDIGRGRSEEHTSELQSLMRKSYAVFCLKKKKQPPNKRCVNKVITTDKSNS